MSLQSVKRISATTRIDRETRPTVTIFMVLTSSEAACGLISVFHLRTAVQTIHFGVHHAFATGFLIRSFALN